MSNSTLALNIDDANIPTGFPVGMRRRRGKIVSLHLLVFIGRLFVVLLLSLLFGSFFLGVVHHSIFFLLVCNVDRVWNTLR